MDRSLKQKINKETQVLNDTLDEMDLTDTFRTFHPNAEEYTFFKVHMENSMIDPTLGHKWNLSKFKKTEIISSVFPDHNSTRLGINYKKKMKKTQTWRLNNTFLNNEKVAEEVKREIKKIPRNKWQWKHNNSKFWDAAEAVLRGNFIGVQSYLKKQEKTSNRQPNFTSKTPGKRRTKKITKLAEERNHKDQRVNKQKEKWKKN